MRNFIIKNGIDSDEIDIIGDIGENWFTEGVTMDAVRAQLQSLSSKNLIVNISSLGGDVNHALAIHDMIKMHPAHVTAKVTGFTASSGTIIAMAADSIEMSDNALFLVHNAWTGAVGNQHDLRDLADELAKVDDRIINIYAKRTGKDIETIHNLMKEEKWIDAQEANEFGFVDLIFEPTAIAASINKIQESELPQVPEYIINSINKMDLKTEFDAFKNSITETIEGIKASLQGEKNVEVTVLDNEEIQNKVADIENKIDSAVDSLQTVNETMNAKDEEIASLQARITELEGEAAQNAAPATEVAPVDAEVSGEIVESTWDKVAATFASKLPNKK